MTDRTNTGKLVGIEAARGFAAFLVVCVHSGNHIMKDNGTLPLGGMTAFAHAGVDLFFVISGFIILFVHQHDLGQPGRFLNYAQRRISRIYPAYWVVLLLTAADKARKQMPELSQIAWDALLLPEPTPIFDIAWTLQHEMVFYVLFAIAIVHRRLGLTLFAAWFIVIMAGIVGIVPPQDGGLVRLTSFFNILFFFGLGCAWVVRRHRIPAPALLATLGLGCFLAAGVLENIGRMNGHGPLARLVYGAAAAALLVGLVELERQNRLRVPRFMVVIGDATYAIYLFHLLIMGVIWQVLLRSGIKQLVPPDMQVLVLIIGCVIGGCLASRVIEKPVNAAFRRVFSIGKAPRAPAREPAG